MSIPMFKYSSEFFKSLNHCVFRLDTALQLVFWKTSGHLALQLFVHVHQESLVTQLKLYLLASSLLELYAIFLWDSALATTLAAIGAKSDELILVLNAISTGDWKQLYQRFLGQTGLPFSHGGSDWGLIIGYQMH